MTLGLADRRRYPLPDLRTLRLFGREAAVLARQARMLHRDRGLLLPHHASAGEDVVVFLHGLFATAGVLGPMKRYVEQQTLAHTASFTYWPGAAVADVARELGKLIAQLPHDVNIHLVGHSMGGVAARYYVQELGGDPRVVQTISLASPFEGTNRAWLWPTPAGKDLCPGSRVLQRLAEGARQDARVPHLSIAASLDQLVPGGARFAVGDYVCIEDCGHNGLLYHPDVVSEIVRRIMIQCPPPSSRSSHFPPPGDA